MHAPSFRPGVDSSRAATAMCASPPPCASAGNVIERRPVLLPLCSVLRDNVVTMGMRHRPESSVVGSKPPRSWLGEPMAGRSRAGTDATKRTLHRKEPIIRNRAPFAGHHWLVHTGAPVAQCVQPTHTSDQGQHLTGGNPKDGGRPYSAAGVRETSRAEESNKDHHTEYRLDRVEAAVACCKSPRQEDISSADRKGNQGERPFQQAHLP
ncbi:hypothetical protein BJ875DRAFT_440186 [Amylocarpus encephaloides]|uniref:Uncharacterized protein n=1 Tax=Amylocarpus encephaloides TaxID=45428 RepID=A0A9P7YKY4_9HELO|nr:hypothetical protein BJ875DRAFT_440186 [Amylocarpus encephaloides]